MKSEKNFPTLAARYIMLLAIQNRGGGWVVVIKRPSPIWAVRLNRPNIRNVRKCVCECVVLSDHVYIFSEVIAMTQTPILEKTSCSKIGR